MPEELDPTLTPTQADDTQPSRDVQPGRTSYRVGELLGKGGMGEVRSAHDARLGREVAIKQLRTTAATEDEVRRFLREAKVQARLDHPAIVPVYDLGVDSCWRGRHAADARRRCPTVVRAMRRTRQHGTRQ